MYRWVFCFTVCFSIAINSLFRGYYALASGWIAASALCVVLCSRKG